MQRVVRSICALLTALMIPLPMEAAGAVPLQPAHPTQIDWNLTPEQITSTCTAQIADFDAAVKRIMAVRWPAYVPEYAASARKRRSRFERPLGGTRFPLQHGDRQAGTRRIGSLQHRSEQLLCGVRSTAGHLSRVGRRSAQPDGADRADKKLLEYYLVSARRSGAALSPDKRKTFIALSNQLTELGSKWQEALNNDATTLTITADQAQSLPAGLREALTHNADGTLYREGQREHGHAVPAKRARRGGAQSLFHGVQQPRRVQRRGARNGHRRALPTGPSAGIRFLGRIPAGRSHGENARSASFRSSVRLDTQLMPQAKRDLAGWAQLKAQETGDPNARIEPWDISYYNNQLVKTKYSVDDEANPAILSGRRRHRPHHEPVPQDSRRNVRESGRSKGVGARRHQLQCVRHEERTVHRHDVLRSLSAARKVLALRELAAPAGAQARRWNVSPAGHRHLRQLAASGSGFARVALASRRHRVLPRVRAQLGGAARDRTVRNAQRRIPSGFRRGAFADAGKLHVGAVDSQGSQFQRYDRCAAARRPDRENDRGALRRRGILHDSARSSSEWSTWRITRPVRSVDTTAVWGQISSEYTPLAMVPGTHPQASFGHLFGYDAGYYSYLWALVYAQDMFTAFKNGGLENPAVG